MELNLKKTFESMEFVSTNADMWSANNKSYLGMTAHWIDENFQSEKAIACKRVRGRHTYDVIASEIEQVHSSYGITHKVVKCVTDNGSNFVKAFRMFEMQPEGSCSDEEIFDEEVTYTDIDQVLSTESDGQFSLSPHLRCASHTLNLISTTDLEKWITTNSECRGVYRSALGKCSALWNKTGHSTLASDEVKDVTTRQLIVPSTTRWNSLFNALSRITEIPIAGLNTQF